MATKSSDTSTRTKSVASPTTKSAPPSPAVSPAGSYVSQGHGVTPNSVAVSLSLKRFKLASLAVVVVSAVVAFMIFFQRGVTLKEVDLIASEANEVSQKKLLDDYNSYTGIASSAITMPIEMFTTMALQLTLLRFVAKSLLVPQLAWRVDKMTAAAAFALVFLVLNGFSALNVQLEPRGVKPVISLSDLISDAAVTTGDSSNSSAPTAVAVLETNFSYVVPENIAGNLVTNTVLRTAVVPRVWQTPDTTCYYSNGAYRIMPSSTDTSVEFGFPTRSWNAKMLPAAPTTKMLTMSLLNGTAPPQAAQLPMNASLAADLLIQGVGQANALAKWFDSGNFPATASVDASVTKEKPLRISAARATGVLPSTDTGDEMKQREWLLKEVPRLLQNKFKEPKGTTFDQQPINDTESGVSLSFSHVELSEQITFDAVTIEAAVNTYKYTTAVDADTTTRYFTWLDAEESCGPKPWSICGVEKLSRAGDGSSAYYDLPSTIVASNICLNGDGTETIMASYTRESSNSITVPALECNSSSNSSMLVVSIAKRIVADSVLEKANARTEKLTGLVYPVLVNARKIYSITVGRLSWQTQDLAEVFGAKCSVTTGSGCQGLQFPLTAMASAAANNSASNESEVVVVSADTLPVKALDRKNKFQSDNQKTPLVRIREPLKYGDDQTPSSGSTYDAVAGDLLLPHNLLVNRTRDVSTDNCQPRMEQRLHITLGNHLYMEHGLQPAYTAAMFYLFQNGVVKKSVNMVTTDKSTTAVKTLSFDKNTQTSALVASIPALNVYQSLVGCALLAIGVLATVFHSGSLLSSVGDSGDSANTNNANNSKNANNTNTNTNGETDKDKLHLAQISDPRVIAQVMLDEGRFPPMFLERTLIDTSGHVSAAEMATFEISSMTLNTEGDDTKCVVLDKTTGPSNGVV